MSKAFQAMLLSAVCMLVVGSAQAQTVVTGVFENLTANKQSGDLDGMRVVIVAAGSGHYAIVQIAQGGAEDPEPVFVTVKVKGSAIEFTVNETKYSGTVSAAGLRLKGPDGKAEMLKRRPCSSFL